ncbi:MAG TPA: TetR family transcriptional regulator [Acidimicrobiales bacterium]|nr:TetR family transcriptional regulator [Acidimicrobiales bacterium]
MTTFEGSALTERQAARRQRVVLAALELAAEGGYDAVQMRDVATRAGVALGTIYRYFTSKDHLLAAAMIEWVEDLERQVGRRPPRGDTPAERVTDVLGRALRALGSSPDLAAAVIAAQTSGDQAAGVEQARTTAVMIRMLAGAFPAGTDPEVRADVTRVLGHVWFSCLIVWANGIRDLDWVSDEVCVATRLLIPDDSTTR